MFNNDENTPMSNFSNDPIDKEWLGDPETPQEWFESVVTEFIWLTGRTIKNNDDNKRFLNACLKTGKNPTQAAVALIKELNYEIV